MSNFSLFLCIILLITQSCNSDRPASQNSKAVSIDTEQNDHVFLGADHAKKQIFELMQRTNHYPFSDTLIKDSAVAVEVVEPVLFAKYGKEQILTERPYEVYLIDGYWFIAGTIPKGWRGGGFEIVLSAMNGKILKLTHYK